MAGEAPSARPVLASLAGYRPGWIGGDLAAGLAIAAVGLPSTIAYPAIAGLPPETGLYASIMPLADSTAAAMLEEARAGFAARGVRLGFAEPHAEVRDLFDRAGLIAAVGPDMIFDDLDDALRAFEATSPEGERA